MHKPQPFNRAIQNPLPHACTAVLIVVSMASAQDPATRVYDNSLTPMKNPKPLLADYPEFVQPVVESQRFEAPMLVADDNADLDVRAWRFSYNARGIIEMPNQASRQTYRRHHGAPLGHRRQLGLANARTGWRRRYVHARKESSGRPAYGASNRTAFAKVARPCRPCGL